MSYMRFPAEIGLAIAQEVRASGRRVRWQPQITYSVVVVGQVAADDYFIRLQALGRIWARQGGLEFLENVPDDAKKLAFQVWKEWLRPQEQMALPLGRA